MEFLSKRGVEFTLYQLKGEEAATVESAARSIGCDPSVIVKNVVFVSNNSAIVVLCSGDRSVDKTKLSHVIGARVRIASREEVMSMTGYVVGGVPPFNHRTGVRVIADSSILRYDEVVTSGGSPDTLIKLRTSDLLMLSGASVHDIST